MIHQWLYERLPLGIAASCANSLEKVGTSGRCDNKYDSRTNKHNMSLLDHFEIIISSQRKRFENFKTNRVCRSESKRHVST